MHNITVTPVSYAYNLMCDATLPPGQSIGRSSTMRVCYEAGAQERGLGSGGVLGVVV